MKRRGGGRVLGRERIGEKGGGRGEKNDLNEDEVQEQEEETFSMNFNFKNFNDETSNATDVFDIRTKRNGRGQLKDNEDKR